MRSRILAASCCLWVGVSAEYERFPLSGIVANGVNVQVKGKLTAADARIDFETPSRQVAFRFEPKADYVARSSPMDSSSIDSFGGFHPFAENEIVTIDFLKTKSSWKVTVDGLRLPWFDYPIGQEHRMTHVKVYSGIHDAQVTLTRPACSTVCSQDECAECDQCFATSPDGCTDKRMTDEAGDDFHCCEGAEDGLEVADISVDSWVQVHDDTAMVESACKAFGVACDGAGLAGKVAQVKSIDASARRVELYVPALSGANDAETYTVSTHVVKTHVAVGHVVENVQKNAVTVNKNSYVIEEGDASLMGKFVHLIWDTQSVPGGREAWRLYTAARFDTADSWKMLVTTIPISLPQQGCTSLARPNGDDWRAKRRRVGVQRRTCAMFERDNLCNIHGEETAEFKDYYRQDDTFADWPDENVDNTGADQACCSCGGGSYGTNEAEPPINGFQLDGQVVQTE